MDKGENVNAVPPLRGLWSTWLNYPVFDGSGSTDTCAQYTHTHTQKPCEWVGGQLGLSDRHFWCYYPIFCNISSCHLSTPALFSSVSLYQTPTCPHNPLFSPVRDCKESPVVPHFTTSGSHTHAFEPYMNTEKNPFSKQHSKFVFISSTQTELNLDRRNNIPTCCVKLHKLMKSAG